jgi:uncharacterized protein (TIGR03086 family)
MLDLEPATYVLAGLVAGVRDEQLSGPTPCTGRSLGDLLDHIDGLSLAFTLAAAQTPPEGGSRGPSADASRLGPDWRTRIPQRLGALGDAWKNEAAWSGMTEAGGVHMPGEVAGLVTLDEVVVHGWDVARACGRNRRIPTVLAEDLIELSRVLVVDADRPTRFAPALPVSRDAGADERLLNFLGRRA